MNRQRAGRRWLLPSSSLQLRLLTLGSVRPGRLHCWLWTRFLPLYGTNQPSASDNRNPPVRREQWIKYLESQYWEINALQLNTNWNRQMLKALPKAITLKNAMAIEKSTKILWQTSPIKEFGQSLLAKLLYWRCCPGLWQPSVKWLKVTAKNGHC